jgi:hypothetical protein
MVHKHEELGCTIYRLKQDLTADDCTIVESFPQEWDDKFSAPRHVAYTITFSDLPEEVLKAAQEISNRYCRHMFGGRNRSFWSIQPLSETVKYNGIRTDEKKKEKYEREAKEITDLAKANRDDYIQQGLDVINSMIKTVFDYSNTRELERIDTLMSNPNNLDFSDDDDPDDLDELDSLNNQIKEIEKKKAEVEERIRLNRVECMLEYAQTKVEDDLIRDRVKKLLGKKDALKKKTGIFLR